MRRDLLDTEDAIGKAMSVLEEQILSLTTSDTKTHDLKLMHFTLSRTLEFCTDPQATEIHLT